MIFRTDDSSYLSANMINAISACEVRGATSCSHPQKQFSWRTLLPTLACHLKFPANTNRTKTEARLSEATINLVPEKEQLSMLCKLVCATVLNKLAMNHINSFDEVHSHQWDSWMREGAQDVQTRKFESIPWWRNPDVQGYEDQRSTICKAVAEDPRASVVALRQPETIHQAPSDIVGPQHTASCQRFGYVGREHVQPGYKEHLPVWLIGITLPSGWERMGHSPRQSAHQQRDEQSETDTENPSDDVPKDPRGEADLLRIPPLIAPTKGPRAKAPSSSRAIHSGRRPASGCRRPWWRRPSPLQEANLGGVPSERLISAGPQRKRAWRKSKQEEKTKQD